MLLNSYSNNYFFISDKSKEPDKGPGPVFGVPLGQCVDLPSTRKRSVAGLAAATATGIENIPGSQTLQDDLLLSPVTKASRSDSRASFGSVQEGRFAGSTESLFDFRRQSLGLSSQSSVLLDSLSVDEVRSALFYCFNLKDLFFFNF